MRDSQHDDEPAPLQVIAPPSTAGTRRNFLRTAAGTATTLCMLGQAFGCGDVGTTTGSDGPAAHIVPTPESIQRMLEQLPDEPFVMLDLFRIRQIADYSAHPELAPATPVTGRELFERYAADMERHLAAIGAERVFLSDGGPCLIGPLDERWDVVQMVRFPTPRAFLALAANQEVVDGLPHRFAMLEDSRVFPLAERSLST